MNRSGKKSAASSPNPKAMDNIQTMGPPKPLQHLMVSVHLPPSPLMTVYAEGPKGVTALLRSHAGKAQICEAQRLRFAPLHP